MRLLGSCERLIEKPGNHIRGYTKQVYQERSSHTCSPRSVPSLSCADRKRCSGLNNLTCGVLKVPETLAEDPWLCVQLDDVPVDELVTTANPLTFELT